MTVDPPVRQALAETGCGERRCTLKKLGSNHVRVTCLSVSQLCAPLPHYLTLNADILGTDVQLVTVSSNFIVRSKPRFLQQCIVKTLYIRTFLTQTYRGCGGVGVFCKTTNSNVYYVHATIHPHVAVTPPAPANSTMTSRSIKNNTATTPL